MTGGYILKLVHAVRGKGSDTHSPAGRSMERYRRVAITGAAAVTAKVITVATTFISVPLTIHYLGAERFGLWMTISSVIAILGCLDLGIGNGLVNAISEADGKSDRTAACIAASSAFFILSAIAMLAAVGFVAAYPFVSWARILNLQSQLAIDEAGPTAAILATVFLINMPLGIVQSIQNGYQQGYRHHFWNAIGALIGLTAVLFVIALEKGLPLLVLAMAGGPVAGSVANWISFFGRSKPWLLPRLGGFRWATSIRIARAGLAFFALQAFTIMATTSDNLVIAHFIGVSATACYAIFHRLYSIVLITQYFTAPLWPAFGEAISHGDYHWARKALTRILVLNLVLGALSGLFLLMFGRSLISWWVGPAMVPPLLIVTGFAAASIMASCGGALASFLNSGPLLNKQIVFYGTASIITLILKMILAHSWGTGGVIWATVLGFGIFFIGPSLILSYGFLRKAQPSCDNSRGYKSGREQPQDGALPQQSV